MEASGVKTNQRNETNFHFQTFKKLADLFLKNVLFRRTVKTFRHSRSRNCHIFLLIANKMDCENSFLRT